MMQMRRYLYIVVFIAGMVSLAVEMAASRLLGNYFGTSNLVWASIIGLILIYLTAGYFIGGAWADRSPRYQTFFSILTWSSLAIALIPFISRPILRLASNAFDNLQIGVLAGSFTSVMILFIVPVTLLGMASPFAIRLSIQDKESAGKIAGRIYAVSTLGSFIGTFLPVLILVPLIGTYRTFLVISAILMVASLFGTFITSGWKRLLLLLWMPVVLIVLLIWGSPGSDKNTTGLIYEGESAYNYVQVLEEDGYRLLRLNEGQGIHSIYHPSVLNFNGPWEQVLSAPFFNPAPVFPSSITRAAIIGLAGGTTSRVMFTVFPQVHIDGVEIDPLIVKIGQQFFDMENPNLNIIVQDGRWALEKSESKYQVISIDAYRPPYIPWHMTTVEFFQAVRAHLTEDGVMVINIGRGPSDRRLVNALAGTIKEVFPTIYVSDLSDSFNTLLFATAQPTSIENYLANYIQLMENPETPQLLLDVLATTYEGLQPLPEVNGQVFTDDHAPVEQITNSIVLNFLVEGGMENLK